MAVLPIPLSKIVGDTPNFEPTIASFSQTAAAEPELKSAAPAFALVVPTLREAGNIGALLARIRSALEPLHLDYEILVVDDSSGDGTAEVVAAEAQRDGRIRLLVRDGQCGLAGAILHGWQHSDAPILGVMDADLQHPPELLPAMLAAMLDGSDLAIGSRYAAGGRMAAWNPLRRLASRAAVWATRPIQRKDVFAEDPMSGFFFVRRECIEGLTFQPCGFKLLLEILVRARLRSVEEIPFSFGVRFRGSSKLSFRVACDFVRLLARLHRSRFFDRKREPEMDLTPVAVQVFYEPASELRATPRAVELQEDI